MATPLSRFLAAEEVGQRKALLESQFERIPDPGSPLIEQRHIQPQRDVVFRE